MKKFFSIILILALTATCALADANSAAITKPGGVNLYLDYSGNETAQQADGSGKGNNYADPLISEVLQLGVNYGIMKNLEIGLAHASSHVIGNSKAVKGGTPYTHIYWSNPGQVLTTGYDLTSILGKSLMGSTVKANFEYNLPRLNVLAETGSKTTDSRSWYSASALYAIEASKEMFAKGLEIGCSFGILNSWDDNANPEFVKNERSRSALAFSLGADYMLTDSLSGYITLKHVGKSNQVGVQQDGIDDTPVDDSIDAIFWGLSYNL